MYDIDDLVVWSKYEVDICISNCERLGNTADVITDDILKSATVRVAFYFYITSIFVDALRNISNLIYMSYYNIYRLMVQI